MAPPQVERIMDPLTRAYADAGARVQAEQAAIAGDPAKWRRRRALAESQQRIDLEMRRLRETTPALVNGRLPQVYEAGARRSGVAAPLGWSQPQRDAVERMAGGLEQDLLAATEHVSATTKQLIRRIGRDAQLQKLIAGGTAKQAAKRMERLIAEHGIHAVRYANGARHGLGEYAQMAVRTQTGIAYNHAALTQAGEHGVEYMEVFDGPSCGWTTHSDPDMAAGKIVTADEAWDHLLAHPNCRRAFGGRPDVRSPDQAANADRHTDTLPEEEMAAQMSRHEAKLAARAARMAKRRERTGAPAPPRRFTDTDEAKAYRDRFDITGDLTYEENGTLTRYTGSSYRRINEGLRGTDPRGMSEATRKDVADLRNVFGKARTLDEDVVVHRGVDSFHPLIQHAESGQLKRGAVIRDDGFLSTSLDEGVAELMASHRAHGGYRFELTVPRGTRAVAGDRVESELIFNSGTRFAVDEVDTAERIIRGRLLPDE